MLYGVFVVKYTSRKENDNARDEYDSKGRV